MSEATLHYLYDPYCGWCFGASPMLTAAQQIDGLHVEPHSVGMLAGSRRQMMSPAWRDFVRPHEKRITALSHVEFGTPYVEHVQEDPSVVLDSGMPTAAMLAAESLSGRGLDMLKRLQRAYYVEGMPIAERDVILGLAAELGFEKDSFARAFDDAVDHALDAHIDASNKLLVSLGARGFPAFSLQIGDKSETLPLGRYYGKPERFAEDIRGKIAAARSDKA